jgi:hypothetical protein
MGLEVLSKTYIWTRVGEEGWLRPDASQTLDDFQSVVAAAEAWESLRQIQILEIHEETHTGRRLIDAVRFRRLK